MKIFVAGGTGFLGKNICDKLDQYGIDYISNSFSTGLDYRDIDKLKEFFEINSVDVVLNCAAYVGGIQFGYKHQAEMFYNNLLMTLNLLECSRIFKFRRVVNPISNCAYPASASLFKEDEFWDGPLHESVLPYGFARKASWVGSWSYAKQYGTDWINLILSNMYGPGDHFDPERSHALGALICRIAQAKEENIGKVEIWGSGKPVREWLYVGDGAEVMIKAMYIEPFVDPINIGIGKGISIESLAVMIKEIVGYNGELVFDETKPDGAPWKTVDGSRGEDILDWSPEMGLNEGIKHTVEWYVENR